MNKFELMDFGSFMNESKKSQETVDRIIEESIESNEIVTSLFESFAETDEMLLESLQSGYLKKLMAADKFSSRYRSTFLKDFYKKFEVDLNSIVDADFEIRRNIDKSNTKDLLANPNKLVFWLNTAGQFQTWSEQYNERQGKGKANPESLMMITRGKNELVVSFDQKASPRSLRGDKTAAAYIGLNKYEKESYKGIEGSQSTSWKALHQISDTLYVLDINDLQEKYGTGEKKIERMQAKRGALALMDPKKLVAANQARYKELKSKNVDPQSILDMYKEAMATVTDQMNKQLSALSLDNMKDMEDTRIKLEKNDWGQNLPNALNNLMRSMSQYAYEYNRMAIDMKQLDIMSEYYADGKMPEIPQSVKDNGWIVGRYVEDVQKGEFHPDAILKSIEHLKGRIDDQLVALVPYKTTMTQIISRLKAGQVF